MSDAAAGPGRRERKKLATRDALRAAARQLFAEQGVAATSIEQITEAADVSQRTFFRYFESKYDLLLPDLAAVYADIEAELAQRPVSEHPLDAYQEALTAVLVQQAVTGNGLTTIMPGLDPSDPALAARLARTFVTWEERLTELFADRMRAASPGRDDPELELHAVVTAGVAVAATRAVVRLVRRNPDLPPPQRLTLIHDAFAFVRAGCSDTALAGDRPTTAAPR